MARKRRRKSRPATAVGSTASVTSDANVVAINPAAGNPSTDDEMIDDELDDELFDDELSDDDLDDADELDDDLDGDELDDEDLDDDMTDVEMIEDGGNIIVIMHAAGEETVIANMQDEPPNADIIIEAADGDVNEGDVGWNSDAAGQTIGTAGISTERGSTMSTTDIKTAVNQTVNQAKDQVSQTAGSLTEQAKQKVTETLDQATEQVKSTVEDQKARAVDQLSSVAGALRQTGQQLSEQNQNDVVAQYTEAAADQIEKLSTYLQNKGVNELLQEAQDLARRRPDLFVAGALGVGFLVGRFLKSSSSRTGSSRPDYQGYRQGEQRAGTYKHSTQDAIAHMDYESPAAPLG